MKTEASKPDFLDMDKDGDKKEPMKKAAKDAKKKKEVKEGGVGNLKIEMEDDAAQMSKQEFIKTHGEKYAHIWDRVQGQMKGDPKYDESRVNEAEQVIKAEKKQKLPSKKSILMMCGKGMSKSAICKEYSGCDQKKLKEMVEACMEEYKKKKNESVTFEDMDGEIVEAQSAKQKAAFKKMLDKKKGKTSDDKEMDEAKETKKKKETVKESVEPKMSFVDMYKMVKESGGQQAIDPMDDVLWNWANRVAVSKVEETNKQEIFAAMLYERNGGRFEMYDVLAESKKKIDEDWRKKLAAAGMAGVMGLGALGGAQAADMPDRDSASDRGVASQSDSVRLSDLEDQVKDLAKVDRKAAKSYEASKDLHDKWLMKSKSPEDMKRADKDYARQLQLIIKLSTKV